VRQVMHVVDRLALTRRVIPKQLDLCTAVASVHPVVPLSHKQRGLYAAISPLMFSCGLAFGAGFSLPVRSEQTVLRWPLVPTICPYCVPWSPGLNFNYPPASSPRFNSLSFTAHRKFCSMCSSDPVTTFSPAPPCPGPTPPQPRRKHNTTNCSNFLSWTPPQLSSTHHRPRRFNTCMFLSRYGFSCANTGTTATQLSGRGWGLRVPIALYSPNGWACLRRGGKQPESDHCKYRRELLPASVYFNPVLFFPPPSLLRSRMRPPRVSGR